MKTISVGLILTIPILAGCSSSPNLASRWHNADQEPSQVTDLYLKDHNIAIGMQNDEEYLYLTIDVGERVKQRQIVSLGLTVWFDYQGGDARRFGVRYPIREERLPFERRQPGSERMPDTSEIIPETSTDEIEIIGPEENKHRRLHLAETKGIAAKIENRSGTLTYSLKVPLMDNGEHEYGIGARAGSVIGLGIETGGFPPGERGGDEPGMRMGGRRGSGRAPGSMPAGAFRSAREPIKFWGKVQLAKGT
ncbi:MAG TPA: hypothetical protein VGR15_10890 [Bacteroidota bacterium]|nr:hypothetical protein [Bacteroidota bacterium]